MAVMLADGGTCTEDIETLRRRHVALFGHVASQPTAWRTIEALAADGLVDIRLFAALATARANAWAAGAAPPGWDDAAVPATIDIDATLVTAHSEKDRTAGTYKGGYGFHPLLAWLDRTDGHGEPLGALLRPGNAGANHAGDNIDVLEQALANLPPVPDGKQVIVRGDSAMATKEFCSYARTCGVAVSVSLPIGRQPKIQAAIRTLHTDTPDVWQPAVRQDGSVREGAHVAELDSPPLATGWPAGLRVIVRREPLHPGAQQTIDDIDGHRFTATLTDVTDLDIVAIDRHHRARARIEDRIKDAKGCGLANLPCGDFDRNAVWVLLVLIALNLTSWMQLLCLDADLRIARLPTLRYRLFHTAARIASHGRQTLVRLQADWP
ncbi:IS1380-like element ISMsm3 family transposase [soil metagenome]